VELAKTNESLEETTPPNGTFCEPRVPDFEQAVKKTTYRQKPAVILKMLDRVFIRELFLKPFALYLTGKLGQDSKCLSYDRLIDAELEIQVFRGNILDCFAHPDVKFNC